MQTSSNTRRKSAFVPWLASLLIGATAHAGWLIHELREPSHDAAPGTTITVEIDGRAQERARARVRAARARSARHYSATTPRPGTRTSSCRHPLIPAASRGPEVEPEREVDRELELQLGIARTDRYTYTIDRRMLDRVAIAEFEADALAQVGVVARALGLAAPIELRNIRAGTPLFLLGLRTGDRLHGIATQGGPLLDRVDLSVERRGKPISLVYRLI